jgi:predicted AlkP superfamily phosphohydrolase/phosphomutase
VEQINGFLAVVADTYLQPTILIAELAAELQKETGDYRIYPTETFSEGRKDSFMKATYDLLDMLTRSALYLAESKPWDLFTVVFFDTDRVLHQMWHYLDPEHPWRTDSEDKEWVVRDYFEKLDESLNRLLDQADQDTLVIILSDHGMGRASIYRAGQLVLQTGCSRKRDPRRVSKSCVRQILLRNVTRWRTVCGWRQANAAAICRPPSESHSVVPEGAVCRRTLAAGLDLLSRGREPRGIVEPGAEYEQVRDEIERLACDFRDPQSGRPLIGQVLRREAVYAGPHLERAPDLILRPREPSDIFFGLADFGHRNTVDTVYRYSGMHRDDGMLIMNGPGVRPGAEVKDAVIYDIAPTVLHCMGLAVPSDMDGHFLEEAFADGYMERFPLKTIDLSSARGVADTVEYTEEGEKEVIERLTGLWYLG